MELMLYAEHLYGFPCMETVSAYHLERPSPLHCTQLTSFQVQSRLFNRLIYREKEEKYFIFIRFLHEYIGNPK